MGAGSTLPQPTRCIHQLFEEQTARTPQAVALRQGASRLTYAELDARANKLARALCRRGVKPETPVALLASRGLDTLVAILAILKAGGAYVPLDPTAPTERLRFMLADTGAPLVLGSSAGLSRLGIAPDCALPLDSLDWMQGEPAERTPVQVSPRNLAYILYTSGSTGRPKGVLIEHRSVVNHCMVWRTMLALTPGDRVLQFAPLYFDAAIWEIYPCLASGATLYVPTDEERLPGPELVQLLAAERISVLALTPTALSAMPVAPLPDLRVLLVGGEVCSAELVARWAAERTFYNAYGPTEVTCDSTVARCVDARRAPPIGRPLPNLTTYVLDPALRPLPPGAIGELHLGGVGLARGYLNQPELTEERFIQNPFARQGDEDTARLYRTGDLVRALPDGDLEYVGRIDDQVKLRGYRIEPGEIKEALAAHPDVAACAVIVREDTPGDKRLVAYVVPRPQRSLVVSALHAQLAAALPAYMIPAAWVVLPELPRTANDKLDLAALPQPDRRRPPGQEAPAAARSVLEQTLQRVFADALQCDEVGVQDDFFALGGDSIIAIKVVARAALAGVLFTVRQLFEHPSIAELAPHTTLRPDAAEPPAASDERPATPAAQRFFFSGLSPDELARLLQEMAARGLPEVEDLYPLTGLQEGLLFHTLLALTAGVYHEQIVLRISGSIDARAMRAAWQNLLDRQPALRTGFLLRGLRRPLQVVFATAELAFDVHDLRGHLDAAQAQAFDALCRERRDAGFDLERAPLLRIDLAQTGSREWSLLLSAHHAILDGWSAQQMFVEAFAAYESIVLGREPPTAVGRSLRDYVERLEQQDPRAAEAYFRGALAGFTAKTSLPGARMQQPGSQRSEKSAGACCRTLPLDLETRLTRFALKNRLTASTLFASAWAILIARMSREDDIVFGMTVAGRPPDLADIEARLGLFINTLPVRARLRKDLPYLTWANEFQAQLLDLRSHESTPLSSIQRWSELPAGQPLFDIGFVYQNFPVSTDRLGQALGLHVEEVGGHLLTSFPLGLMVTPGASRQLRFEYDANLFPEGAIERLCDHYLTLLSAIVDDPQVQIAALPLLSPLEQAQILIDWNRTEAPLGDDLCVHELFAAQAARAPDALALMTQDARLTYAELEERAGRLATKLVAHGVGPDVVVGLFSEPAIELIVGVLAVLKAGGAYVPLPPELPAERLAFQIKEARARLVLVQAAQVDCLPKSDVEILLLDGNTEQEATPLGAKTARAATPEDLCYVIFTSGSTGQPKAVAVPHRSLVYSIAARQRFYEQPVGRLLQVASFAFDSWVGATFWTLCTGGTLVLPPASLRKSPELLTQLIAAHGITHLMCVPSVYAFILEQPVAAHDLSTLTTIILGGENIPPGLIATHRERVRDATLSNEYGPTEATVWSSAYRIGTDFDGATVPIGRPITNVRLYVLDERLAPVPYGVPGELYIGGAALARGYLNQPALTAERFIPDPFSSDPAARLYRTGDQARLLADGNIEFIGRLDQQIKLRGYRIELGEIEVTLQAYPEVRACAAAVYEDPDRGKRLVAYVVPHSAALTALPESETLAAEQVAAWRDVYNGTLAQSASTDAGFDISGWNSSYTDQPLSAEEMWEWREGTLARLLGLSPRRVWEIGCGTGLLLLPLAPRCVEYLGTDISATALRGLAGAVQKAGLQTVRLLQREAVSDAEPQVPERHFDLVILNSVIQYFPDESYLQKVLAAAERGLVDGGVIFIGDVRNYDLLLAFYVSVERAHGREPEDALRLAHARAADEEELLVAPAFFHTLCASSERIRHAEILVKHGRGDNEMNRYRYDVLLYIGSGPPLASPKVHTFAESGASLASLPNFLVRSLLETGDPIELRGIPNAHVASDVQITEPRSGQASWEQLAPADLVQLAEALNLRVRLRPSETCGPAYLDALWERREAPQSAWPSTSSRTAGIKSNDPLRRKRERLLEPRLRGYLAEKLPDYMIPADLVFLQALPLTVTGKLDRGALPAPPRLSRSQHYIAPRTPAEQALADAFAHVLGHKRVGIHDNFFALGGHSLQTLQVVSRAARAGFHLSVRDIYTNPTVATLASAHRQERPPSCVIPLADGAQPGTLVFVPAVGGHLTAHIIRLAHAVSGQQTIVGLTTPPHHGGGEMPTTMAQLASHYGEGLASSTPSLPITLIGYCFGGLVALELALALEAAGLVVSQVIMLESDPPSSSAQLERFDRAAALLRIAALWGLDVDGASLSGMHEDAIMKHLVSVISEADIASAYEESTLRAILETQEASHHMVVGWTPRVPKAPIHLLRASEDPDGLPFDYGWGASVKLSSVTVVPGDHHGFIRPPHLETTVRALTTLLDPSRS